MANWTIKYGVECRTDGNGEKSFYPFQEDVHLTNERFNEKYYLRSLGDEFYIFDEHLNRAFAFESEEAALSALTKTIERNIRSERAKEVSVSTKYVEIEITVKNGQN